MTETDENLMLAVRNGDVAKLGPLFDRHHRALFDFFVRMTGSRSAAEDLVQDVFFRILKYRQTFRAESRFKSWMFHIARNARCDYFKRRQSETPFPEADMDAIQSGSPLPDVELEHAQHYVLLECALFKLAPEKREVLILSRYQDMRYEEIAELMGCEVNSIKVRVHRALKELREIFLNLSSSEKLLCNVKKPANNLRTM